MTKIIELRPNKSLMNTVFEKYQFSSDIVPIISEINLRKHVYRREPNQDQESWLEARLFAYHNHLFRNMYDMSCWFIDEDWAVWCLDKNDALSQVHTVHIMDEDLSKITYNPSIEFASDKMLAISDGGEKLEILVRNTDKDIRIFSLGPVEPGIIMDMRCVQNNSRILITMCAIVASNDQKKYTRLALLSYALQYAEDLVKDIFYIDKQMLKVQGTVDYIRVEENGNYLHSVCQNDIDFEKKNASEPENEAQQPNDPQTKIPKYYWSQEEDTLSILMKVPKRYDDKQPKINITALELSVTIDDEVLIQGEWQHRLEENMASWRYKERILQIDAMKHENGLMWSELLKKNTEGEYLPNEALATEIHQRLAHLCTDQHVNNSEGQPCVGFNAEQLEECDLERRDNLLQRVNLFTQATTHLIRLGSNNHILFTCKRKYGQAICLRHDHDACVWVIDNADDELDVKHIHSFPGFGYVEASKTNKKFCVSPIDGSYIAIVEHARHVFLYEKPDVGVKVSKQRIIDLNYDHLPIMGVVATNRYLILLSKDKLYRFQIRT